MRIINQAVVLALAAVGAAPFAVSAQQARSLSLDEALRVAEAQSDAIRIARAGVTRARGQQLQASSAYLPQIAASLQYTRTLASQFDAFSSSGPGEPPPGTPPAPPDDTTSYFAPCTRYLAPPGATDAQRVRALETAARCAAAGGGGFGDIDFESVGFGARNQYTLGLQGSLELFSGGRTQAQNQAAAAGKRSADIELTSQRAQLALQVTEAYFDATLADRLVAIAESSLAWTERAFRHTTLARQVGNSSEFDLLRAQVTRDNQRPALIQRRWQRDLAYLRLKQLLSLPYEEPVMLTTRIEDDDRSLNIVRAAAAVTGGRPGGPPDTSSLGRAPVRQVAEALRAQEAQLSIAKSQRWPTLNVTTQYARLAFARGAPKFDNLLTNWNVTVGASVPLFTGGRIRGEEMAARAAVAESEARLDQMRKLAALDTRQSLAQLEQAESEIAASQGTAEQALKAYRIAEVRFSEGISTQLELSESRLLLEQAQANRALAARNLHVARVRLALIRDLPLGAAGSALGAPLPAAPAAGGAGAVTPGGPAPGQPGTARPPRTAATSVGPAQ
ncbi:MAG: TolC family protein [Gemmatimonadaceae bacterium]